MRLNTHLTLCPPRLREPSPGSARGEATRRGPVGREEATGPSRDPLIEAIDTLATQGIAAMDRAIAILSGVPRG